MENIKKLFIVPFNDAEAASIIGLLGRTGTRWVQLGHESDANVEFAQKRATAISADEALDAAVSGTYFAFSQKGWGVTWSDLEEEIVNLIIQFDGRVFAIEILGAETAGCQVVDHHRYADCDYSGRPTSIEQIATICGIELTLFERFIAANDVGYIPGMVALANQLGLSDDERIEMIESVRNQDGKSQGANSEAYQAALEAIRIGFPYDARLMVMTVPDLRVQTKVVDALYKMGKYRDMVFNNLVCISQAEGGRVVVFCGDAIRTQLFDAYNPRKEELGLKAVWTGGNPSHGFWGIQFNMDVADSVRATTAQEIIHWLEDTVLGYRRMIAPQDIIATEQFSETVHIHEITGSPAAFHAAISAAKHNNPFGAFVHLYDVEEYTHKRLFIVNAGAAGFAITHDGDIVSVFKNDKIAEKDFLEKATNYILIKALKEGGKKLDCFEGFLPNLYAKFGFEPVCRVAFDPEYKPDGWKDDFGQPDIIFFRHNGDSADEVLRRQASNPYGKYDGTSVVYAPSYDAAGQMVLVQLS